MVSLKREPNIKMTRVADRTIGRQEKKKKHLVSRTIRVGKHERGRRCAETCDYRLMNPFDEFDKIITDASMSLATQVRTARWMVTVQISSSASVA